MRSAKAATRIMRVTTWIDRVTDETNSWFIAQKLEDSGKFGQAAIYYLRDATASLDKGFLVRAALSCTCAASCIERLGNSPYVPALFREAALIYLDHANSIIGRSTREYVWALQRSYECFLYGYDDQSAAKIHQIIVAFEKRMNPFVDKEETTPNVVRSPSAINPMNTPGSVDYLDNTEIVRSAEAFLQGRRNRQQSRRTTDKQDKLVQQNPRQQKGGNVEKSVTYQLG